MSLTPPQLLALHHRADQLVKRKLALISARVFSSGHHPSIHEIYTNAAILLDLGIPAQHQIWFILSHYDAILSTTARKSDVITGGLARDIAKAI
jgi:hypothetical protein